MKLAGCVRFCQNTRMDDTIIDLKNRLSALKTERRELDAIQKEAFMAAPPMPGGGQPPMDPSMMQGGPPMDPSMMQGGPPMDPSMMQGGPPMDPSMMQGGQPQGGGPVTPEMLEQLLGVIEELAASSEQHEQALQQLAQQNAELADELEETNKALAELSGAAQPHPGYGS